MKTIYKFVVIFSFILVVNLRASGNDLTKFFAKDSVVILVTDSGLGGLSIAADLLERIKTAGLFKHVNIIFFNAQPHIKSGYNSMKSTEQKVEVFNNALTSIQRNFHPDIILIGCNTLSVIYEYTNFSKTTEIPVFGIIETGVNLIYNRIHNDNDAKVIIFATETTVGEAKHKAGLISKGISEENIITVACPKLAGNIERDTESRLTDSLVTAYVDSAAGKLSDFEKLYVSYNCTHYGYIDNMFQKKFAGKNLKVEEYLNPNPDMNDILFDGNYLYRYKSTETSISVVSQAELTPGKIGSIYNLIEPVSPDAAEALFDYKFEPNFFEWSSIVGTEN